MGNRKKANSQFKVGQDILINQRRHHWNQLGRVGELGPKAVLHYNIKKQVTQNVFEMDIPAADVDVSPAACSAGDSHMCASGSDEQQSADVSCAG